MNINNETSYDAIAEEWNRDREQSTVPPAVEAFAQKLPVHASVLDVGCGSGVPIDRFLAEKGYEIKGLDISEKLLQKARVNVPSATYDRVDIIYFQSGEQYDGIVAWDSLFHLSLDEQESVLKKLIELLKPNGLLVFTHGGNEGEIQGEMHGQPFSYSSLGPEKIKTQLQKLNMDIHLFEIDPEGNGYLVSLVQKK